MTDEEKSFNKVKAMLVDLAETFDYETTETSSSFSVIAPKWSGNPSIKLEME